MSNLLNTQLSLAMIVKNEALVIERILQCAQAFCDEMVVVDTGSTDETVALAKAMGATVYHFDWVDDFAAARNFAFDQASHPWVIWLDADDVIDEENIQKIKALKSQLTDEFETVMCDYQIVFDSQGNCVQSIPRERLIRHASGGEWRYPVHETYIFKGKERYMERLDIKIQHHKPIEYVERSSTRNLDILTKSLQKPDADAVMYYYLGKEQRHHGRIAEALDSFTSFLNAGVLQNSPTVYQACHQKMLCEIDLEHYDEAIISGFKAVSMDSSRSEAYVDLGVVYYRQQKFLNAIPLLTAATVCQKPPAGMVMEEYYAWKPWHYLSLCYEGAGLFSPAIKAAKQSLLTIPDQQVALDNIHCFEQKLHG